MKCTISYEFASEIEMHKWIASHLEATNGGPLPGWSDPATPEEMTDTEAAKTTEKAEKEKREKKEKKEKKEKSTGAARADVIASIRAFVLENQAENMKKLIPLMPVGKKSLDALELEEAQRIAIALGID